MKCTVCHTKIKDADYYDLDRSCCLVTRADKFKRLIYKKIRNGENIVKREYAT